MVMDFCDGTLVEILDAAQGTLPDKAVLKIFADVCGGVMHMHSQQPPIAHRWQYRPCCTMSYYIQYCITRPEEIGLGIWEAGDQSAPAACCRDLKAENVMVHSSGSWLLCDFGSATNATLHLPTADIMALAEVQPLALSTSFHSEQNLCCSHFCLRPLPRQRSKSLLC